MAIIINTQNADALWRRMLNEIPVVSGEEPSQLTWRQITVNKKVRLHHCPDSGQYEKVGYFTRVPSKLNETLQLRLTLEKKADVQWPQIGLLYGRMVGFLTSNFHTEIHSMNVALPKKGSGVTVGCNEPKKAAAKA